VGKTYQQLIDEEAEKKEQAEIARREALMSELAAAEQSQAQVGADGADDGTDEGMEERDLDADVPDADADGRHDDDDDRHHDDDDEDDDDADEDHDVTFNEESLLEGSDVANAQDEDDMLSQRMIRLEEAELDGTLQEERDFGLGRNLDDDVPDADSWEHTDTEEEIDSTDHDIQAGLHAISTGSPVFRGSARRLMDRRSLGEDADLGSSSFVNDSPMVARGAGRGNAWRSRVARGGRRLGF